MRHLPDDEMRQLATARTRPEPHFVGSSSQPHLFSFDSHLAGLSEVREFPPTIMHGIYRCRPRGQSKHFGVVATTLFLVCELAIRIESYVHPILTGASYHTHFLRRSLKDVAKFSASSVSRGKRDLRQTRQVRSSVKLWKNARAPTPLVPKHCSLTE